MRLERLACRGFSTAFPGPIDLALGDLPPGVIAVVGPNGHGKTALLELAPGVLYRQLPARGDLDPVTYATSRDSCAEIAFRLRGRGALVARLNLDGPKRQTDAVLLEDGAPLNPDGKRTTYDALIGQLLPSYALFINSAFAAQGRGDEFSRRKPAERRVLFSEFLGLDHYARRAAIAKDAGDLADDARLRLEVAVEQLERATGQAAVDELDRLAKDLQVTGGEAEIEQRRLVDRVAQLEDVIALAEDPAAAIAAASQRARRAEADLAQRRSEQDALASAGRRAEAAARENRARIEADRDRILLDVRNRIAGNEQLSEQADAIRAATVALPIAREQLTTALAEREAARATRDAAAEAAAAAERALQAFLRPQDELARAQRDSALLKTVPCGGAGPYRSCQFLADAAAAAGRIAALEAQLAGLAGAVQARDAARAGLEAADPAIAAAGRLVDEQRAAVAAHERLAKYATALAEQEARVAELRAREAQTVQAAASQLAAADAADEQGRRERAGRAQALAELVEALTADLGQAAADLEAARAGDRAAAARRQELADARAEQLRLAEVLAAVRAGHDELARRRRALEAGRLELVDWRARLSRVLREKAEWRELEQALKKLPDLEIDAAGPGISARTNELLLHCYGARFALELVTQVEKADGSGFKDLFTVRVFDNEKGGGWRDIAELSGGQKVVIQEALMAAIALYVNERLPVPIETLWRDETGAALDAENRPRYVEMLRKVREVGGFHHVFFVSHDAAAAALADAQIRVQDGQAAIVLPPFQEAA